MDSSTAVAAFGPSAGRSSLRRITDRSRKKMQSNDAKRHDVIVVGGGQAGLAIGYLLAQQGHDFTILEAAAEPAAAWRARWDSLELFTAARCLSWQHTRGSALLGWVRDDAEYIAQQISTFASTRGEGRAPERVA